MLWKKYSGIVLFLILLLSMSSYGQNYLDLIPYNGTPASFLMTQIKADTLANHGVLPDRVYRLQRGGVYLNTEILNVDSGQTIRFAVSEGTARKPIIFQYPTGTGATPHRPPGNLFVLRGGNVELRGVIVSGFFEPVDSNINNVQGGLINTTQPGCKITIDDCILTNINGQHVRTGSASALVKVTNSIFANMGALTTSNFGAGKGIDLREASCDSLILVNNTFVNYQDRVVRHYNFGNPSAGTGNIGYCLIDHNSFINGMGFHGLLSLGNVGEKVIITNNLFVDAFASGEDENEPNGTRSVEWANTGETYTSNGANRQTWIFTAPNTTTNWTVEGNYFTLSDSGQAFIDQNGLRVGSQLSWHINSRLGADSVNAFTRVDLELANIPKLMTNLMRWYRSPLGGNFTKNTPSPLFNRATDDMDRKGYRFYSDSMDASYATTSAAYTGAGGFPAGDLNWFPDKKAQWESGVAPFNIVIDGEKDEFYNTLTGPDDGYLQIRSYAWNDNGRPRDDDDLSAKVWAAWDADWLYYYTEVKDDTISGSGANSYQDDGLELKIDPVPTAAANSIFAPNLTILGGTGSDSLNVITAPNKQWVRKQVAGGYVLELAIKWSAVVSGTETVAVGVDGVFGLAINYHDNDHPVGGTREHSVQWAAVLLDNVWNTPANLGTIKFLADNKLQFIPTNNFTPANTNNVPYDGSDYIRVGVEDDSPLPTEFGLSQNYPNPFNPSTKIIFTLKEHAFTVLSVYNVLGQKVATLVSNELPSGMHQVNFDASNLSSGIYLYKLESGKNVSTRKMLLMK